MDKQNSYLTVIVVHSTYQAPQLLSDTDNFEGGGGGRGHRGSDTGAASHNLI